MAWTNPTSRSAGDMITAAIWNGDVVNNLAYLIATAEPNTLTNKSGGTLTAGAVVIVDTANDSAFTTTTSADSPLALGVVMESIANNAAGRVAVAGIVTVDVQGNVTRGNYLSTSTTAGRAKDAGTTRSAATFARALTAYAGGGAGTVTAILLSKMSGIGVGAGSIFWFIGSAPTGYTEYTSARGRVIVGLPSGGTNAGTVGTALTNLEDQTHTHPYSQVDDHAHNVVLIGATGSATLAARAGTSDVVGSVTTNSTGSASATSGSGSHMTPYIQLRTIEKS